MTHESTLTLPVAVEVDKALFAPAHQAPAPVLPGAPADTEQVRALEVTEKAPAPLLQGRHLLELGASPGPAMGRVLKAVYDRQ